MSSRGDGAFSPFVGLGLIVTEEPRDSNRAGLDRAKAAGTD